MGSLTWEAERDTREDRGRNHHIPKPQRGHPVERTLHPSPPSRLSQMKNGGRGDSKEDFSRRKKSQGSLSLGPQEPGIVVGGK